VSWASSAVVSGPPERPGDLALRKAIQRAYGLDHLPSQAEVVAIAEAWRPHRSLAVNYLFASVYGA
jgi:DNA-3-methyladenine glycosylase II